MRTSHGKRTISNSQLTIHLACITNTRILLQSCMTTIVIVNPIHHIVLHNKYMSVAIDPLPHIDDLLTHLYCAREALWSSLQSADTERI